MQPDKPPLICLMGPTASGKTDLAIQLAERRNCELISVDSALVYRGLDIGSAKPDYPHHLVDIRDPSEPYSAADFAADARRLVTDIQARGKTPLLVGGTMLYFRAFLEGLADMPAADPAIRAAIEQEAAERGWPHIHAELAEVDPEAAARIHPNHSQRLARALEVYRASGIPMSEWHRRQGSVPDGDTMVRNGAPYEASPDASSKASPSVPSGASPDASSKASPGAPSGASPDASSKASPSAPSGASPDASSKASPDASPQGLRTSVGCATAHHDGENREVPYDPYDHFDVRQLAICPKNRVVLHERIALRFEIMMREGFLEEVRGLYHRRDLTPDLPAIRAVGYRQLWQHLAGECSLEEAVQKAIAATRQLAKRQLTWLRKWPDLGWIYTDQAGNVLEISWSHPQAPTKGTDLFSAENKSVPFVGSPLDAALNYLGYVPT